MSPVLAQSGGTSGDVGGITGFVLDTIDTLGAVGLAVLTVIDTVFPPVPSELFLPIGGYLASQDRLHPVAAWAGATVGSMIGAWIIYWMGLRIGRDRVERGLGHIPLVEADDLQRAFEWFDRHGSSSVLFGRVVPGVRSFVSFPAGANEMGLVHFSVLTFLGSAVWNGALIAGGWFLGSQWKAIETWSSWLDRAIIAAVVFFIVRFFWKRRDRFGGSDDTHDDADDERQDANSSTR